MRSRETSLPAAALVAALALLAWARVAHAQNVGWIVFSPDGDSFSVQLPAQPSVRPQAALPAVASPAGRLYEERGSDGVEYRVWSLERARPAVADAQSVSDYLDSCAEMAWTLVVDPELDRARSRGTPPPDARYGMEIAREAQAGDAGAVYSVRVYGVTLGARRGRAHVVTDGARAYVALAYGPLESFGNVLTFLDSFALRAPDGRLVRMKPNETAATGTPDTGAPRIENPQPNAPATADPSLPAPRAGGVGSGTGGGVGPGRGGNTGGGDRPVGGGGPGGPALSCEEMKAHIFSGREVTRRAQIFRRPEPMYTEWARRFLVTGTVRLRGVLNTDGAVTNIAVLTRLPHGLTVKAVEAMRAITFEPAQKDGCKVSQYVMVEYNFNIY